VDNLSFSSETDFLLILRRISGAFYSDFNDGAFELVGGIVIDLGNPTASMIFFADTVQTGEKHIVAVTPLTDCGYFYGFTSRYSLFRMDQLDEILEILGYVPKEPTSDAITIANGGVGATANP